MEDAEKQVKHDLTVDFSLPFLLLLHAFSPQIQQSTTLAIDHPAV